MTIQQTSISYDNRNADCIQSFDLEAQVPIPPSRYGSAFSVITSYSSVIKPTLVIPLWKPIKINLGD